MKRAAIYVRTSSEHQAEKASPEEQERDCRQLAAEHGLEVVEIFRDVQKYRVKGKLVDPSGTRADRPGLVAMIAAAERGEFDTLIAWKEDRLYRGLKAAVFVLEGVQDNRLDVLLAKENFDARMAPVKAWVAGMELDNLKERMSMGVKARLRAGKANTGQDRFGYKRMGGDIVVVEEEAQWVRQIFTWYCERVSIMEIRRRLIEAGVQQKGGSVPRKIQWSRSTIQAILKAGEEYALGIKRQSRGGEVFTLPVESIIPVELWQRSVTTRQLNKTQRKGYHVKYDYLCKGLIRCQCGRTWSARRSSYRAKSKLRKTPTGAYYCPEPHKEMRHPDCPRWIGCVKADEELWAKVESVLREPETLLAGAREHVGRLRANSGKVQLERDRLERELAQTADEVDMILTLARKRQITDEEMERQLAAIRQQEVYLRQKIGQLEVTVDLAGLVDWEVTVREYLADLREGVEALAEFSSMEETVEEAVRARFELRRAIVKALVERIEITKSRKMTVLFRLDMLGLRGGEGVRIG